MAAGPGGVDIALLTAAAKALRDVSVLDKQFLRAREVPPCTKIHQQALFREALVCHIRTTSMQKRKGIMVLTVNTSAVPFPAFASSCWLQTTNAGC